MRNLPTWLHVSTLLDPLTYAVDPMRRAVLAQITDAPGFGVTWSGWAVPTALELAIVAGTGVIALVFAAHEFGKAE
jgi:ABC-2 type transport system permease protein